MSMDVNLSSTLPDFSSRSEASFCCVSSSVKVVPENAVETICFRNSEMVSFYGLVEQDRTSS